MSFGFLSFISPMLHNEITLEYFYKSYYYWIILKKIQNENSLLTNYYDFRALILFLNGTSWKAKKIILFCTVIALKDQCWLICKRCLEILYEFFTCGKILWGMNYCAQLLYTCTKSLFFGSHMTTLEKDCRLQNMSLTIN